MKMNESITNKQTTSFQEDSAKDIKKIAKGAGISLIGSGAGRGLFFVSQLIIARCFSVEIFGLYTLGLIVLRIADIISRLGLHSGAMRFVSIYRKNEPQKLKGILISAFLLSFVGGIVMGGVVYLLASVIAETIFHKSALVELIKAFAICVPFVAPMIVISMAMQGFQTTKYSVLMREIIQPSTNVILVIFFVIFNLKIYWVIYAFALSHAIALVAGFYFIARQFPTIKRKILKPIFETKKLLTYSVPLLLSGFLGFFLQWVDIIMLGFMKTSGEVAIYRAASQIPTFFMLALGAINSIYAPSIAEMYHRGQIVRMGNIYKTSTRWVFLLTLPASIIVFFSAGEILSVFGNNYRESGVLVLQTLTVAQFVNCVTGGVAYTLAMTGRQKMEMFNSLTTIVINIVLCHLLIPKYGSYGAAIATGISIASINLIRMGEVYFLFKIQPYNMSFVQGVISGVVSIMALYFQTMYLSGYSTIIRLVANSFTVITIFIIFCFIKGTNNEDRLILEALAKKIKLKKRKIIATM